MKDYYQILEISIDSHQAAIREQYRFLVQAWHPDKFPVPEQKIRAEEKIKEINVAYGILSNPAKRAEYDRLRRFERSNHQQENRDQTAKQPSEYKHRNAEEQNRPGKTRAEGATRPNQEMKNEKQEPRFNSFCPSCGEKVRRGDQFCHNCGKRVG